MTEQQAVYWNHRPVAGQRAGTFQLGVDAGGEPCDAAVPRRACPASTGIHALVLLEDMDVSV
jgi:hypothetical protein